MTLTDQDILDKLVNNPAKTTLDAARKQSELLNVHITGQNLAQSIKLMDYFEDEQKKNLRQKYARSNKDLFSRLHRPLDKVFRAKGGSLVYNMDKGAIQEFTSYIAGIRNGMSLRKWIQMVALPAFQIDPMGLIFMEIDTSQTKAGKPKPYPTYKSTQDIYDYQLNGRRLEYVIFKLTKGDASSFINGFIAQGITLPTSTNDLLKKIGLKDNTARYYRVVDDVSDKIIEWDGNAQSFTEVAGVTLTNPWLTVPAMVISDIVSYNSDLFLSPDDMVVELANDYLTDVSVFNIFKKLHGFPKAWRFRSVCSTCQGTKLVQGRDCPDCNATGYRKTSTPRDEIVIPLPEDGAIKLPNSFGGYITPDIQGWEKMTEEQERLECLMFFTMYGTTPRYKADGPRTTGQKTATEEVNDIQSMIDRLDDFRQWGQDIDIFVTDMCGNIMYGSGYKGSSINWGNRFQMESPDAIWQKYSDARQKGAPQATLDGHLRDFYESRYATSPMDLQKALKEMRIEPFTHFTPAQVEQMTITDLDKASKLYFSEWLSTKLDMDIITGDEQALRDDLLAYAQEKLTVIQAEEAAEAALMLPSDSLDAPVVRGTTMRVNS